MKNKIGRENPLLEAGVCSSHKSGRNEHYEDGNGEGFRKCSWVETPINNATVLMKIDELEESRVNRTACMLLYSLHFLNLYLAFIILINNSRQQTCPKHLLIFPTTTL